MRARWAILALQLFLAAVLFLPATALARAVTPLTSLTDRAAWQQPDQADFPVVDPHYIYDQLFTLATRYQSRQAGYDTTLPNGHTGFADYWAQEMVRNLQGFGATVRRDPFPVKGWRGRPATSAAFNVEVSVPGAVHPEQVVIVGCHFDGEAISTQSAYDDASGCAIELGVAKALGEYWRQHNAYPARTLRFVIFDAEEQGLYGSFHYVNNTVNGDLAHIVAMFNEEQNGIAYPLRYLGQLKNPLLPFYIEMSPLTSSDLYPGRERLTQGQKERITHFRALMQRAVPIVFQKFQDLGYRGLTYHDNDRQDVVQPIFTPEHQSFIHVEDDTLGGSDQIPFTLAGVPCATFAGNSTYYDNDPPAWSYPFDQRQDTIQLMNTFASGSSKKSSALVLALALPGMLTTWMLNQPTVLGTTGASTLSPGAPLASIDDIGITQQGRNIALTAKASFDPQNSGAKLNYRWEFGDGARASGVSVTHAYAEAGTYMLKLTVSSESGQRIVSKQINVVTRPVTYKNPYAIYQGTGDPPHNPKVVLPTPDDTLSDRIASSPAEIGKKIPSTPASPAMRVPLALIVSGSVALVVVVLVIIGGTIFLRRRRS